MAISRAERRRNEKLRKNKGIRAQAANLTVLTQRAARNMQAGQFKVALRDLEKLLCDTPNRHDLRLAAGQACVNLDEYERGADHYRHVVQAAPQTVKAQYGLALCLKALGEFQAASTPARIAVQLSKDAPEPLQLLIDLLWALGESADIPALCRKLLVHKPHRTDIAMYEGMAYYHLGERQKGRAIFGFDDLVEVHDLEAPEAFSDIASFNKALAEHIVNHPSIAVPDKNHPTYHNDQLNITHELIGPNATTRKEEAVEALTAIILDKVDNYLARRKDKLDHGFIKRWPKEWHLTAWGTLLRRRGNLLSHIHLDGYLGMVYYPELPLEMRSPAADRGDDQSGFLVLGEPPDDFPVNIAPDIYTIQPKEGRLVMFPGYFFHRTNPFQSTHRRISIAFDVVARR